MPYQSRDSRAVPSRAKDYRKVVGQITERQSAKSRRKIKRLQRVAGISINETNSRILQLVKVILKTAQVRKKR